MAATEARPKTAPEPHSGMLRPLPWFDILSTIVYDPPEDDAMARMAL
jgi:hypothetical protein